MRQKFVVLATCTLSLLLVGGLILGGVEAAAQSSEPWPILILTGPSEGIYGKVVQAVSAEDGTVLWYPELSPPDYPYTVTVNPDRASLVLETRFGMSDVHMLNLARVELPASVYLDFQPLAGMSYPGDGRQGLFHYALSPDQTRIVAVAGRKLVVSQTWTELSSEWSMPSFPLETWILPDQEVQSASVVMDPLGRRAYVRLDVASGAFGYDTYVALWIDLADLAAQPVETEIAWVDWSADGVYLATFASGEGLVIRDGDSLEALPWSADLASPLEAHSFVWGTDGTTAYYATGDVNTSTLHRIDLVTGDSRVLMADRKSYGRPVMHPGGGGNAAFFDLPDHPMSGNAANVLDLTTGEWATEFWPAFTDYAIAISPIRDFFLMMNATGFNISCEFHAWREGIELGGRWSGPVLPYGWTPEGLPILQTLALEDVPEYYTGHSSDRATSLPDPGWYIFDIAEDGAAIWTALPCPDCRVIPAGFPEVQLSVQRPDGAPVFAVVGTGDAGSGVYVVDLVAGTAKLVSAQEPDHVTQIDWLAPGSLPLELAPAPTHVPGESVG